MAIPDEVLESCRLCPRRCGVNRREGERGFCGCGAEPTAARAALHQWEEPCLSGTRGSGTVFFTGCTLRCRFCQNYEISAGGGGRPLSVRRLADIFLELQEQGAHNINLVTATPHLAAVSAALELAKPRLSVPVVFNSGGYERAETVQALDGLIDVYLPDMKYVDPNLSAELSAAPDYFAAASAAIPAMIAQVGPPAFGADGLLRRGVMVRHLVLPGSRRDSMAVLRWMKKALPPGGFLLSLMSQYTPVPAVKAHPHLRRRLTTFEYDSVVNEAVRLGLTRGYMQEKSSAKEEYTPPFDGEGV